jgi:hypothetical protein
MKRNAADGLFAKPSTLPFKNIDVLNAGLQVKGTQFHLFLILRKTDHKPFLAGNAIESLDVFQFNRGIAAKGDADFMVVFEPNDIHRPFWETGIAKGRNGVQSLPFQELVKDASNRFLDYCVTQVPLGNTVDRFDYPFLNVFFHFQSPPMSRRMPFPRLTQANIILRGKFEQRAP